MYLLQCSNISKYIILKSKFKIKPVQLSMGYKLDEVAAMRQQIYGPCLSNKPESPICPNKLETGNISY